MKSSKTWNYRRAVITALAVLAVFMMIPVCRAVRGNIIRRREAAIQAGKIVIPDSGKMQIQTRYYTLNCPEGWREKIAVECFPADEKFLGDQSDKGIMTSYIDPENYTLRLLYHTEQKDYPVADLTMACYLQDYQDLHNWTNAGQFHVDKPDHFYDTSLLVIYPDEQEAIREDPEYQKMRGEVFAVAAGLVPRTRFLQKEDMRLYISWRPNSKPGDHGTTWEEYYAERDAALKREQEEKRKKAESDKAFDSGKAYSRNGKQSGRSYYSGEQPDPYSREDYDDADDFADDWADEFNEYGDEDEGWEAAHDYYEGDD